MTNTAIAETMNKALAGIGWKVGPVEVQANGEIGFVVNQPAKKDKRGNITGAAERQIRTFAGNGVMTIAKAV